MIALVRDTEGKFLLIEDKRDGVKGFWAPPHGCQEDIDKTESDAVIREVKEKVGIVVKPIKKILTQRADTTVKTVTFWTVSFDNEQEIKIDNTKLSKYGWFTLDEALNLSLYPGTKIFFDKLKHKTICL